MAIPETQHRQAKKHLEELCDARIPILVRDKLVLQFRFAGNDVELFTKRSPHRRGRNWTEDPVAKFRYVLAKEGWRLMWADRNGDWHYFDDSPPSKSLRPLIRTVQKDPTGIFWG